MSGISTIAAGLTRGIAAIGLALVGVASAAHALPITIPTGLNPGDQYRLAFVTTTTRDATSSNIADYNAFVTAAANSQAALVALGTTWTAIASTETVDARDNTGTNPSSTGVPIYLLNDTKIADDNADLWDGTIDINLRIDQNGNVTNTFQVWTGSKADGTEFDTGAIRSLGNPANIAIIGNVLLADSRWVTYPASPSTSQLHQFYALSGIITVPEPTTALLLACGLVGLAMRGRRH